jgi:hypothetical protein
MNRSIVLIGTLLIAGCASGGGGGAANDAAAWIPGAYLLEARVPQVTRGARSFIEHRAELVIAAGGSMTLTSSEGLCQDPAPAQAVLDEQRRQRTFLCGLTTRYELRPGAGTPRGELTAEVEDEELVVTCVRYERRPDGTQVCVETEERLVVQRNLRRVRLQIAERVRT